MRILPAAPASSLTIPTASVIIWIVLSLAIVVAPQTLNLPIWISAFSILLGIARVLIAQRGWPLPNKWLRLLLAIAALVGVYVQFGTLLGRDAGVALLTIMLALKLLETKTHRDAMVLIFMGYFLVVTSFLYTQAIPGALYMFLAVWILTGALIHLNRLADQSSQSSVRANLRLGAMMLMQAIPFMLLLFILFPRVSGALWSLPSDARGASTGLSDTMSPGNIGSLAQSQEVAFRAAFVGKPPVANERYWRGPVFWFTDGRSWSAGRSAPSAPLQFQVFGEPFNYTVTLEPHQKNWLFALDLPVTVPDIGRVTGDFQLLSREPVKERVRYEMRSYPHYQTSALTPAERERALQLPVGVNPRTSALAITWRQGIKDDDRLVQHALDYFRNEAFFYTLTPPLLGQQPQDNTIDQFLFDTRRGFCEHYAAAFATLMRAAGIPTRIVTGYQGGELNPLGDYLIVRQADAHAWAEVWLQNRGWVRVDPTAAIAPWRIERGSEALDELAGASNLFGTRQGLWGSALLQLRFSWDAINYQWAQWVLGYGQTRQQQLLAKLGLDKLINDGTTLGIALGVAIALLSSGFGVYFLLRQRRVRKDLVVALYERFCAKLARRGIVRAPSEGAQDFAVRAAALRPPLAQQIEFISRLYSKLRYGLQRSPEDSVQLRKSVRTFRA